MPGDGPERFEAYLELEQFLADLQADKAPHLPDQLTADQERIYHLALLFRAATPGTGELRRAFTTRLQLQMEEELRTIQSGYSLLHTFLSVRTVQKKQHLSRRVLLVGGTTAASAVAGAGSAWIIEQVTQKTEPPMTESPTTWFFVTTVAELGNKAVQFAREELIGYVVRSDGTNGDPIDRGQILALSAACTHKGCIVQWTSADRTFRCPCHGGVFTEHGEIDAKASIWLSLKPLARLEVKVEADGKIYVRMPA